MTYGIVVSLRVVIVHFFCLLYQSNRAAFDFIICIQKTVFNLKKGDFFMLGTYGAVCIGKFLYHFHV